MLEKTLKNAPSVGAPFLIGGLETIPNHFLPNNWKRDGKKGLPFQES